MSLIQSTSTSSFDFCCQICGKIGHGNHFGAITCRACSAFFRRAASPKKRAYKCKTGTGKCSISESNLACKRCRLEKCYSVGMSAKKFQFERDSLVTNETSLVLAGSSSECTPSPIPMSLETFLGRSNFIVFFEPEFQFNKKAKVIVDVDHLIEQAVMLFRENSGELPSSVNSLQKLSSFYQLLRTEGNDDVKTVRFFGKAETFILWEHAFMRTAKWLLHFDEFQSLSLSLKVRLLKTIWHVWSRLDRLALTASNYSKNSSEDAMVMLTPNCKFNMLDLDLDISWCSNYPREQLFYFTEEAEIRLMKNTVKPLVELDPTDVEMNFMLIHLCFHYAGKKLQGDVLEMTDKILDVASNQLHDYYVNVRKMPLYSHRLSKLMNIINLIQKDIWERRARSELAKMFDVFRLQFSDPEMFEDSGCVS